LVHRCLAVFWVLRGFRPLVCPNLFSTLARMRCCTHAHAHTHIHIRTYAHTFTYTHAHTHTHTHTHTHAHTHAHTHSHTHTYTHTSTPPVHTQVPLLLRLLEFSVLQLSLHNTPPRQAACQELVLDLSALLRSHPDCTASSTVACSTSTLSTDACSTDSKTGMHTSGGGDAHNTSSGSSTPSLISLRRRFLFWSGRLQVLASVLARYTHHALLRTHSLLPSFRCHCSQLHAAV